MTSKPIKANLKMRLKAGQASAAPPVGSMLGQHGVNMMDFINPFNEQTKALQGANLTVHITIYEDKSLTFRYVSPPVDELIRDKLKIDKGSGKPNSDRITKKLSLAEATAIAELKLPDMNTDRLESVVKMVKGTARSMGVEVE